MVDLLCKHLISGLGTTVDLEEEADFQGLTMEPALGGTQGLEEGCSITRII